jgi:membrane protease YdiL (CAAX protease family)
MPENILDNNFNKPTTEIYGINKYSYFSQVLIWFGLFSSFFLIAQLISGLIMVSYYGTAISNLTNIIKENGNLNGLRIAQMIATVISFLVPAIIFSKLKKNAPSSYSGATVFFPLIGIILIPFILYTFYPILNLSFFVNKISPWNNWMSSSQQEYKIVVEGLLKDKSVFIFLLNLITIAILPAICEEWIFRGTLQKILSEKINIHLAIFFTSIVFSLIHFDFAAFLPRIILSLLLGYVFYFSGSLWASIFLHAVNNGAQVILMYCNNTGIYKSDVDNPEMPKTWELIVYSLAFYVLMSIFYYFCNKKKRVTL